MYIFIYMQSCADMKCTIYRSRCSDYQCSSRLAINKASHLNVISFNSSSIQFSAYDFIEFVFAILVAASSSSEPLSPSESDPTDPALFLSVLLYADLTVEEMFCLVLKCEQICGRSAKSHYSPPCSAALHEANLRRRKKTGEGKRKCSFSLRQTSD